MPVRRIMGFESDLTFITGEGCVPGGLNTAVSTLQRHRTASGYGGAQSLRIGGSGSLQIVGPVGGGVADEIHVAIYRDSVAGGGTASVVFQDSANADQFAVTIAGDGLIRLRRGGVSGTIVATSAAAFTTDTWNTFKIVVTLREAASAGRVQVFANGSAVAAVDTGAGVDCRNTAINDFFSVTLSGGGASHVNYFDDFYWTSTGLIPDEPLFIPGLDPTSDTATVQFTPSTGADAYAVIDENPVSTADYNETTVAGDEDRLNLSNLPGTPVSVLAVKVAAHGTGDGTLTNLRTLVESNGSTTYGTNQPVASGSYSTVYDIYETDPSGGAAWTPARIDAMIAGYEANT